MLVRRQFASARKEEEEEVVDILHDSDGELPDLKFEPVVIENESKCGRKRKGWWHEMSSDEEESIVRDLRDRELFEKMERLIYQEEQQKKEQIKSKSWMQKIRRTQQELKRDQSFQQFLNANVFDPDEDDMVDEIPDPQYQGKDGKACRNSKPPPSVYRDLNEPDGYNDEISRVYWKKYNEAYIVCDDWEWPDLEILSKKARSLLSLEKKYLKKMKMAQKRANKCVSGREDSPELIRNGHIGTEYSCLNGSQELINGSLSPTPTPSPQSPMNESAQGSPMNDMSPRFSPQSPIFPSSTHSGTNEPHSPCNGKLFVNKICATSAIDLLIQVAKSKEKNPEKKEEVRKQPTLSAETLKLLPCRYAREETSGGFR